MLLELSPVLINFWRFNEKLAAIGKKILHQWQIKDFHTSRKKKKKREGNNRMSVFSKLGAGKL